MYPLQPHRRDHPYLGYLTTTNILIVTGESESMLAEAVASGKPVYIYALPDCFPGVWGRIRERFREWVVARANARPANNRGTVRPQQGLERLCARIISRGIVLPPRNIRALHQRLFRLGVAWPFTDDLVTGPCPRLNAAERVPGRIRALLEVQDEAPIPATTRGMEFVTTNT